MDELSSLPFGINFRSMGMKLIVCTLALFMTIPALFVEALIRESTGRSADAEQEISGQVGGQQTFLGPTNDWYTWLSSGQGRPGSSGSEVIYD